MKIQVNQIRPGIIIEYNNSQWLILKTQHVKPGKGGAFNQVEMRDIKSGSKTNVRLRTQSSVEKLNTSETEFQYLYNDGNKYTFMNPGNFEQIEIDKSIISDNDVYLQEGMTIKINTIENEPIGISLPETMTFEVVEAEPVVKGQTAASSSKPAVLENGLRIMVPPFVEQGSKVIVNTSDGSYLKRAD